MTSQAFQRHKGTSWFPFMPSQHSKPWTTTFDLALAWRIDHDRPSLGTSFPLGINLRPCMLKLCLKDVRLHHRTPLLAQQIVLRRSLHDPRVLRLIHPNQDRAQLPERSPGDPVGVNRISFLPLRHHLQPRHNRKAAKIQSNALMKRSSLTEIPWTRTAL